jgi:23S rRNA-/tRNA-specific pseudouridylate synthase
VDTFGGLFESRSMEKVYLAVVRGAPKPGEWTCRLKLAPDPASRGRMKVDAQHGKESETHFRVLQSKGNTTLVEAHPVTGRTHQIRVHLAESGYPVVGDPLYGPRPAKGERELGLRAVRLSYVDPFLRRRVEIRAPLEEFVREYGFDIPRL